MTNIDPQQAPKKITIHKRSKRVTLHYALPTDSSTQRSVGDDHIVTYELSAEYLRVFSPSAEVQGHGKPILQTGKKDVGIDDASVVGLYGVKFYFDDNHNTGIYTWPYLKSLCNNQKENWNRYIEDLHQAGKAREKGAGIVKFFK